MFHGSKVTGRQCNFCGPSVNDVLANFIFELIKALRKCWYGEVFFQMVKTHYLSSYQTIEKNSSNHSCFFFFPVLERCVQKQSDHCVQGAGVGGPYHMFTMEGLHRMWCSCQAWKCFH